MSSGGREATGQSQHPAYPSFRDKLTDFDRSLKLEVAATFFLALARHGDNSSLLCNEDETITEMKP